MTDAPELALVETRGLTKSFGSHLALDNVSLRVRPGRSLALTGRNGAGKSTVVSILTGLTAPDSGEIEFSGAPAPTLGDRDAWRSNVACVYQHSTIIPDLTVAENLFINRQSGRGRLIRWRELRAKSQDLLEQWSVPVSVDIRAGDLTVEQRQLVEIARSLSYGARLIILDEPTARLDGPAIRRLFDRMRSLQEQGVTFLFISHHLDESYEICSDIAVLRDGRHIVTAAADDLPKSELVAAMTGEAAAVESPERTAGTAISDSAAVLKVRGLTRRGEFDRVDLDIRPGEIVGLAGGATSGRVAVAETIAGLRRATAGSVIVDDTEVRTGDVRAAWSAGIGCVPNDRHHEGLVLSMSLADNATLAVPHKLGRFGRLSRRTRDELAMAAIDRLDIKASGPSQNVGELSGGNQQKVVFARALADDPSLLVLINPTAGVDVRSKATLLELVRAEVDSGSGALLASDELDDLRACDRVLVMVAGQLTEEFAAGWKDNDLVAAMERLQ